MSKKKKITQYRECISCMEPMVGIFCYSIRAECCECGGESLAAGHRSGEKRKHETKRVRAA